MNQSLRAIYADYLKTNSPVKGISPAAALVGGPGSGTGNGYKGKGGGGKGVSKAAAARERASFHAEASTASAAGRKMTTFPGSAARRQASAPRAAWTVASSGCRAGASKTQRSASSRVTWPAKQTQSTFLLPIATSSSSCGVGMKGSGRRNSGTL